MTRTCLDVYLRCAAASEGSQRAHPDSAYRYELTEITGATETPTGVLLLLL